MIEKLSPKQIQEHKLEGYFHRFLPQLIQNQHKVYYQKVWKAQWLLNHQKIEFLKELNQWAKQNQSEIVLLKGAALLQDYYTDLGSRFMSDIDILIEPKTLTHLNYFLESNGFKLVISPKWKGNNFKRVYKKGNLNIEIHHHLFFHTSLTPNTIASPHFDQLKTFSNEDQFVYLCGHYAFQHNCLKLYWLIDLFHLSTTKINWSRVKHISKKYQLRTSVKACQWILNKKFNVDLPTQFCVANLFLSTTFLTNYSQGGIRYHLLKHLLKDDLATAIKYDFFWLISTIRNLLRKSDKEKNNA